MFAVILATVICSAAHPDQTGKPYPVLPLSAHFYTVDNLLDAMYTVESNRGKITVGDDGKAIGPYQIWREYWHDAVEFDKTIGGKYEDCMNIEQLARIHNGGPQGHTRTATLKYWKKIVKEMTK